MSDGLVGQRLAEAAHPICRAQDPEQNGLTTAEVQTALTNAGIEVGGKTPERVLRSALNGRQDLFELAPHFRWRWIEPVVPKGPGLSGRALAEEAYRLAIRHDPQQQGLHYEALKQLLVDSEVIIKGANPGKTVFASLNAAAQWFRWSKGGIFTWR